MIAVKKYVDAELRVRLRLLVGELQYLERNVKEIPIRRLLEQWEPEISDIELLVKLESIDELREQKGPKRSAKRRGSKGAAGNAES